MVEALVVMLYVNVSSLCQCIFMPCKFFVLFDSNAILICIHSIISSAYVFMMNKHVMAVYTFNDQSCAPVFIAPLDINV